MEAADRKIRTLKEENDSVVIKRIADCLADSEAYFNKHMDVFLERGIEDFLYFVRELKGMRDAALPLEAEWFDKNADVSEWCAIIDGKWKSSGICLAGIDIESDSYILFPCRDDKLDKLKKLAKIVSCRIDYAKNL